MLYSPSSIISDPAVFRELQRIAQVLDLLERKSSRVLSVAPEKPRDGDTAICDGINWNPIGDGIKRPVWYNGTTESWSKYDV